MTQTKNNPKTSRNQRTNRVTWAEMTRDVFITAINRGQLPILGILLILCIVVWRLPVASLSALVNDILNALKAGEMWSYGLLVIVMLGWFVHSSYMRKLFSEEMRRVGKEKSELQNQIAKGTFKSSE